MTFLPQWKSFELLPRFSDYPESYQRICEEHFDRFGFVDVIATPIWIEIAPLFKRIELAASVMSIGRCRCRVADVAGSGAPPGEPVPCAGY